MSAPSKAETLAFLRGIVATLSMKSEQKGLEPISDETKDECIETLAHDDQAFGYLDDQEARLGLHVADERAILTELYQAHGFPARLPLPAPFE